MAIEAQTRNPERVTFDDVWKMFQENAAELKETERILNEKFQETDKRFQETDKKFQETAAQMKETDKKIQETAVQLKETGRKIDDLGKQMGGLHNSFGELAEHLVAPSIAEKFNVLGYHFDSIAPGGKKIMGVRGKVLAQIDLLLENGEYSVAVEVKSRPKEEDITKHITRLETLRQYMDKHHDSRIICGALAGAVFPEIVKEAAIEAGFYVIVQTGDTMQIETPQGFTPREW
jgi:prefoldin subunit 5